MNFNNHNDFDVFQKHVRYERRYIYTKSVIDFLEALKSTLPERTRFLSKDIVLHRAQNGYDEIEHEGEIMITGFSEQRMKPNKEFCGEGRANPRGIPYLYLSSDENTCMAELRPHRGQLLSVAQFQIQRTLKIIDCFSIQKEFGDIELIFNPPTTQADIRNVIWSKINQAFSRPISRGDTSSEYVPTQVLVEFFYHHGFDGVCFKSSLGKGHNFVLFDISAASLINCGVYDVRSVNYEFSECANRYYKKRSENIGG